MSLYAKTGCRMQMERAEEDVDNSCCGGGERDKGEGRSTTRRCVYLNTYLVSVTHMPTGWR
jgi:hypothetical protein